MIIFPIIGFFTLLGLLYAKYRQNTRLEWLFKPATSILFVLTGLTTGGESNTYTTLIIAGLILGLVGDVLLIYKSPTAFMAGLGVFLLGHLVYVGAFQHLVSFADSPLLWVIILGAIVVGLFFALRHYLGTMQGPVVAYMGVISLMVLGAINVYQQEALPKDFRQAVLVGAICFYLSDLAVALDQFVKPHYQQAYWGLPLYYIGQFLLALSVGMFS